MDIFTHFTILLLPLYRYRGTKAVGAHGLGALLCLTGPQACGGQESKSSLVSQMWVTPASTAIAELVIKGSKLEY